MSMWTAIALIAVAGIIAGIFTDKGKRKHSDELHQSAVRREAAEIGRLDILESDLRKRVETLERIVTNPKENLKRQFDHLDKAS